MSAKIEHKNVLSQPFFTIEAKQKGLLNPCTIVKLLKEFYFKFFVQLFEFDFFFNFSNLLSPFLNKISDDTKQQNWSIPWYMLDACAVTLKSVHKWEFYHLINVRLSQNVSYPRFLN